MRCAVKIIETHFVFLLVSIFFMLGSASHAALPVNTNKPGLPEPSLKMPNRLVIGRYRPEPRVVLLKMANQFPSQSLPGVERRTIAELKALGLEVIPVESRAEDLQARLGELGAQTVAHRAVAAIRIVRGESGQEAQVWLYDALTGKMLFRETQVERQGGEDAISLAAMQVIELIHASFLELSLPHRTKRPRPPVPEPVQRMVSQSGGRLIDGRFVLAGGAGVLATIGGHNAAIGLALRGSFRPTSLLSIGAEGFVPLRGAEVQREVGNASIFPFIIRMEIGFEPWPEKLLSPQLDLGLGGLFVQAAGDAIPPHIDETEWSATFQLAGSMRLALKISDSLQLVSGFSIALAPKKISIRFGEEVVAEAGMPQLEGNLALSWRWGEL